MGHHMNAYPEISRRVRDKYHNLEHDEMVKSIFNLGKNKVGVGMKVDVSTTQSQPIESTQGTHRRTSAPRSPNPDVDEGESSAQRNSIVIRLQKVKEHLVAEETEKMVEGTKSEDADEVDNSILNSQNDSGTRVKEKNVEESRNTPSLKPIIIFGTEKLQELTVTDPTPSSSTPSSSSSKLTASHASYLYSNPRLDLSNNTRASLMSCKDDTAIYAIQQECKNLWAEITSQINNAIITIFLL
ncbi:hypothetical protein Tco_1440816, partial [Tanacetum coccineum]